MTLTGFAVCARTFVRINLYAKKYVVIPHQIAMGFLLQIRMSWLRARFQKGVGAGVVVLGAGAVSWLSARLRRAAALVGCWCQLIARGVVSWLRRLRTFLFQPVACQQVVGFCLAIWVYAGVI